MDGHVLLFNALFLHDWAVAFVHSLHPGNLAVRSIILEVVNLEEVGGRLLDTNHHIAPS